MTAARPNPVPRLAAGLARRIRRPLAWARYRAGRVPLTPLVAPPDPPPPCGLFHEIPVVAQAHIYNGHSVPYQSMASGPVWPEGATVENWMRHCIYNYAYDVAPERPGGPMERIDRPCVWLGYMHLQFGHLVAEHLTRALWSRHCRPDDLYLYALPPGRRPGWPDYHFLDLMAWYGLPPAQLRQVTTPVLAAELRVYPQGELLGGAGPSGEYLDLLDRHVAASGLVPVPSDLLFVTRAGMLRHRTGSHAGEGYLAGLLRRRGVAVLDPVRSGVGAQLAAYAGARRIVFSEGSALHGRQLLGRLDQDLIVLNRRPGARTAQGVLIPRCRSLRYVEATAASAVPVAGAGDPRVADALALYDVPAVLAVFAELGVDLSRDWDEAAYRAAVASDAAIWARGLALADRGYQPAALAGLVRSALDRSAGGEAAA